MRTNLLHVAVVGCLCALTQARANTIVLSGHTFSVNNSESGNYIWSPGSYGDCQGSLLSGGCGEVGGGYVHTVGGGLLYENKRAMSEFLVVRNFDADDNPLLVSQAILTFEVYSPWGYYIQGNNAGGGVVAYQGNGVAQLADWGRTATATLGTFSVAAACNGSDSGPCQTISLDVTGAYNQAILSGWSFLGIRLEGGASPNRASVLHHFRIQATTVPLPGAAALFVSALLGLAGCARRASAAPQVVTS